MDTNTPATPGGNGSDSTIKTGSSNYDRTLSTTSGANSPGGSAGMRSQLTGLKADLDALVNRAPGMSDDELAVEHAKLMAKYNSLRFAAKGLASQATQQLSVGYENASRQFNRGVETTTGYVKEKPMQSVAVAAGAGLLLAMLFKRR
ncbi:MAG TPA: DUF883 domain-containing protein [Noviherbaspirillum sp.]|jgi:ElaB/YqjD/DUF883 family membrane-anchored ribosome-binding protein|uniref:DUF883 family protein n=1 Tax=Noviherbaspirillum sp. TaxID=1926288 RepID=UPI002DDCB446|nr:DUF883 domain-containing protein [Noviherbaspirillum sp.]HEV2610362.1 DUF883 domain-containing protein [Noviherbaspirillum sp.]